MFNHTLSKKLRKSLLAILALVVLLAPSYAVAAEQEGSALFFSLADLTQILPQPVLPSLSEPSSSRMWQKQDKAVEQKGPMEWHVHWGTAWGIDAYADPGSHWALWRF